MYLAKCNKKLKLAGSDGEQSIATENVYIRTVIYIVECKTTIILQLQLYNYTITIILLQ